MFDDRSRAAVAPAHPKISWSTRPLKDALGVLVDLLISGPPALPTSSHRHQWLSSRLWAALNAGAPRGMWALEAINVRYREIASGPEITLDDPVAVTLDLPALDDLGA